MKPSHCLILALAVSLSTTPVIEATGLHYQVSQLGKAAHHVAKAKLALPVLATKKALLLGHLALPLAAAKGTFVLGTAGVGAVLGVPIGAIAGAKIGAAMGAIKGAAIGKSLLVAKKALALKALAVGAALAAKPVILAAGIKAAILAKKAVLVGHGISLLGKGMQLKGRALTAKGAKIAAISSKIKGVGAAVKAKIAAALVVPKLPAIKLAKLPSGPKYANVAFQVAHPLIGYQYGQAVLGGVRKKRDSEAVKIDSSEPAVNELITIVQSRNAQQCLARVICELSADANFHGNEGIKFGGSLMALGRANHPRAEQFRSASAVGTRFRNPAVCSTTFTDCTTPSNEVIRIGNALING